VAGLDSAVFYVPSNTV